MLVPQLTATAHSRETIGKVDAADLAGFLQFCRTAIRSARKLFSESVIGTLPALFPGCPNKPPSPAIREFPRVHFGRPTKSSIPCAVHRVISDVVTVMRVRADEKNISLEYQFDGEIDGHADDR